MSSPTKASSSGSSAPMRRPSALKSKQILDTVKARETVATRAAAMSAEDIDRLYNNVSTQLKSELGAKKVEVDKMQEISDQIDSVLSEIRVRNKEEMVKTERRLSRLQIEVKALESGQTLYGDQEGNHKDSPLESRRQSVLSQQITKLHKTGSGIPALESIVDDEAGENSEDEESSDDEPPPPPPLSSSGKQHNTGASVAASAEAEDAAQLTIASRTLAATVIPEDAKELETVFQGLIAPALSASQQVVGKSTLKVASGPSDNDSLGLVVTHERKHDPNHDRYYYVDRITGASQWKPPATGIIVCTDPSTNRQFYKNMATGKTSWKLQDLPR